MLRNPNSLSYRNVTLSEANYGGLPLSAWMLDQVNGTTATDIMASVNGTYTGGYTLGASGVVRNLQKAVTLNGALGSYVNLGANFAFTNLSPFSAEIWFFRTGGSSVSSLIGRREFSGGTNRGWMLYWFGNALHFGRFNSAGTSNDISSAVSNSVWYHAAGTFDGTTQRLYINGDQVASTSTSIINVTTSAQNAAIGSSYDAGGGGFVNSIAGTLQAAAIYNYALAADRIKYHYLAGINGAFA